MQAEEVHLAPGVPSIESLGARVFDDFFRTPGAPGFERAKLVSARDGFEEIRYPLPGTPRESDEQTKSRGRPIGAGTGFVILRRFTRSSLRERWRARFTHPRSTSLGEREWNLVCHLRARGIGAPEPLAVGRGDGGVFAERSFVAVRELEGMLSLKAWAGAELDAALRVRIREALSLALERMWRAGVWLPSLSADNVLVAAPHLQAQADPDCVARAVVELRSDELRSGDLRSASNTMPESAEATALKWGDLPEVAFTELRGGRLLANVAASRKRTLARELEDELQALRFELGLQFG